MKRSSDDNFFVENNRRFFKFIEELAKRGFVELKEGEDHSTYPYSFYITGIYSKYAKINVFMRSLDEVGKYFGNSEVTRTVITVTFGDDKKFDTFGITQVCPTFWTKETPEERQDKWNKFVEQCWKNPAGAEFYSTDRTIAVVECPENEPRDAMNERLYNYTISSLLEYETSLCDICAKTKKLINKLKKRYEIDMSTISHEAPFEPENGSGEDDE